MFEQGCDTGERETSEAGVAGVQERNEDGLDYARATTDGKKWVNLRVFEKSCLTL